MNPNYGYISTPTELIGPLEKYGIVLTDEQRELVAQTKDRERFDALTPAQATLFRAFASFGSSRDEAFRTVSALAALVAEAANQ